MIFLADVVQKTEILKQAAKTAASQVGTGAFDFSLGDLLNAMNLHIAVVVFIVGLISLFIGWRVYRILLFVAGALVGSIAGSTIAHLTQSAITADPHYPLIVALIVGSLFAFLAIPYIRFALFALAGLAGGYAFFLAGHAMQVNADFRKYFALAGFVVCGLVSFAFFEVIIVIGTSFLGAGAIVTSVLFFVKDVPIYADIMQKYSWLLPVVLAGIAVFGMLVQFKLLPDEGIARPQKRAESDSDNSE